MLKHPLPVWMDIHASLPCRERHWPGSPPTAPRRTSRTPAAPQTDGCGSLWDAACSGLSLCRHSAEPGHTGLTETSVGGYSKSFVILIMNHVFDRRVSDLKETLFASSTRILSPVTEYFTLLTEPGASHNLDYYPQVSHLTEMRGVISPTMNKWPSRRQF